MRGGEATFPEEECGEKEDCDDEWYQEVRCRPAIRCTESQTEDQAEDSTEYPERSVTVPRWGGLDICTHKREPCRSSLFHLSLTFDSSPWGLGTYLSDQSETGTLKVCQPFGVNG